MDDLRPPQDPIGAASSGKVVIGAAEKAEELIEASLRRLQFRPVAKVPLADHAGRIAQALQPFGQRRLLPRQPELRVGVLLRPGVRLKAEPLLVAARHEPGPGRRADRAGDVAAGEPRPVLRDGVDVGRGDVPTALHAQLRVAQIIGQDQHDVGPPRGPAEALRPQPARQGQRRRTSPHEGQELTAAIGLGDALPGSVSVGSSHCQGSPLGLSWWAGDSPRPPR